MFFNQDLTNKQFDAYYKWFNARPIMDEGSIGGRYTWQYTMTSLGLITKVIDNCTKEELDLTDYDSW